MLITSEKASRYYVEEIKNGKFVYVDAKKKPKKFKVLMKVRPGLLWFLLRRFLLSSLLPPAVAKKNH